jgi:hypothetical protein
MPASDTLEKAYRTSKIISTALAGSLLIYVIIVEVLKFQEITFNIFPTPLLDTLRFIFVFLSFADYFIINFVSNKLLIKKPEDDHKTLLGKLARANIMSLTLCDLPALFGFVLFLGSGNSRDFYLLLILSLLLLYSYFPRYSFWAAWSTVIDKQALL